MIEVERVKHMSVEEAIEVLAQDLPCETDEDLSEAMIMAIKALETVSCIKEKCAYCPHCENCDVDDETLEIKALDQQPCEDVISRDCDKCAYYVDGANDEACDGCFADEYDHPNFKPKAQHYEDCISRQAVHDLIAELLSDYLHDEDRGKIEELDVKIEDLEPVTPKEKSEYEHDHEVVKAYNDGQAYILDKIRAEIEDIPNNPITKPVGTYDYVMGATNERRIILEIIDKYRGE